VATASQVSELMSKDSLYNADEPIVDYISNTEENPLLSTV